MMRACYRLTISQRDTLFADISAIATFVVSGIGINTLEFRPRDKMFYLELSAVRIIDRKA